MAHSTRSNTEMNIYDCIKKGLASDGGLFVFDEFKTIDLNTLIGKDYKETAYTILSLYLDDENGLRKAIENSYNDNNFKEKVVGIKTFDGYSYLELFHGPTAAFKDMALTFLPNFVSDTEVLVATSGDTGSATLSGFLSNKSVNVTVLYPNGLVSPLQEKQMLYFSNGRNKALALKGNFDDCQRLVKEISVKNNRISSANSINIGRLLPQIVYYFYGYIKLVEDGTIKLGDKINVSVPTGNFGNILAGWIAKNMGLPIDKFICACNENKVLYDFINTGIYDRNRSFHKTYSPSMDILVSSNMERLIYYFYKDTDKVNSLFAEFNKTGKIIIPEYKELFKDFSSFYSTNEEILETIKDELDKNEYLIDPHTAVAKDAYKKSELRNHTLILSTASPYKFEAAFNDIGIKLDYSKAPIALKNAINCDKERAIVDEDDVRRMFL